MLNALLLIALAQAPLGVGQVPTSSLPSFPPASYIQHIFFDQTTKCLMHTHGGISWRCLAEMGEVTSAISSATSGLASTSYVDASAATVSGNIPSAPRTLLPPAASDPATSTVGASYFNTTGKCLKTWNGASWSPAACATPTVASIPSASTPPAGTSAGDMFNDTTQGCTRRYNGATWGPCLTTELCGTASVTGITLPLGLSSTISTATISGAVVGRPCTVSPPSGTLLNVGVSATCSITSANTASFRMQGSLGLAIVGGTYTACTHVPW